MRLRGNANKKPGWSWDWQSARIGKGNPLGMMIYLFCKKKGGDIFLTLDFRLENGVIGVDLKILMSASHC